METNNDNIDFAKFAIKFGGLILILWLFSLYNQAQERKTDAHCSTAWNMTPKEMSENPQGMVAITDCGNGRKWVYSPKKGLVKLTENEGK